MSCLFFYSFQDVTPVNNNAKIGNLFCQINNMIEHFKTKLVCVFPDSNAQCLIYILYVVVMLLCLQAKGLCGECRFNCCQGSCGEWCVEACRASCDCRSPSMTGCLDAICPQRRVCRKYISFWHFSITSLICGREIFIKIACQLSEG